MNIKFFFYFSDAYHLEDSVMILLNIILIVNLWKSITSETILNTFIFLIFKNLV